jgi:hypothetical protein
VSQLWEARGLLVSAPLPLTWAVSHAALPVVFAGPDGQLRLTCSARDGKGRSQIATALLDLDEGAAFDERVAVGLGALGAFDDNGVTSSCAVEHEGRLFQYYTGWTLGGTVPFHLAIGCAVSEDGGRSFEKVSHAPVLGRTDVDPLLTASPCVLVDGNRWRMWYVSGTEWALDSGVPRHRYLLKYAESADGLEWEPTGRVSIDYVGPQETAISRPCVVRQADGYRMWFSARGTSYRIGHARSSDGIVWERTDDEVELQSDADGWDSDMQAYPWVFDHEGERHMLYNGNGYGATGIGHAVLRGDG